MLVAIAEIERPVIKVISDDRATMMMV